MSVYNSINNHSNMKSSVNKHAIVKHFSLFVVDKNLKGSSVDDQSDCFKIEINPVSCLLWLPSRTGQFPLPTIIAYLQRDYPLINFEHKSM